LDPAKKAFLDADEKTTDMDIKGEQLFYKLANLDDRIKNADQVRMKTRRMEYLKLMISTSRSTSNNSATSLLRSTPTSPNQSWT
jgi:hypothetical protein